MALNKALTEIKKYCRRRNDCPGCFFRTYQGCVFAPCYRLPETWDLKTITKNNRGESKCLDKKYQHPAS